MMSEDVKDPLETIAKGSTKATYEHIEERLSELVVKFRQGELAFIEDEETIDIVRKQRKKPAWKIYRDYVHDKDLRLQIEMGFSLKALENKPKKLNDLKNKIYRKYGTKGLHLAELSQNGLIERYLMFLIEETENDYVLQENVEGLLEDVDRYVKFIKTDQDIDKCSEEIKTKIRSFDPNAFIIFSKGEEANDKSKKIIDIVMQSIEGYRLEVQKDYQRKQKYYFIVKVNSIRLEDYLES